MLEIALNFLTEEVKPVAHALDAEPAEMKRIFGRMAELKLLSLRRSVEYGGPNISERDFRFFQEEIARASGALAFLQTQHQSSSETNVEMRSTIQGEVGQFQYYRNVENQALARLRQRDRFAAELAAC